MQVPVTFIYGEHDWMNPATGKDVCSAIEAKRGKLTPEDLKVCRPHLHQICVLC